jgi:hypothetical protein
MGYKSFEELEVYNAAKDYEKRSIIWSFLIAG